VPPTVEIPPRQKIDQVGEVSKIYMPSPIRQPMSGSNQSNVSDENFGSFSCFLQLSPQGLPNKQGGEPGSFEFGLKQGDSDFNIAQLCESFKFCTGGQGSGPILPNFSPENSFQFARCKGL
jgi:hypothetical protein